MSTLSRSCPCEAGGIVMNDLEAAAEHAVLTGQVRSLVAWVGSGRKLTQTGRIGLADARHLVEVLGTGDTIDPKIGDRVFKTKSSEELAHLTRIVEWAKAARLVRVSGTRLVPVKKNATPARSAAGPGDGDARGLSEARQVAVPPGRLPPVAGRGPVPRRKRGARHHHARPCGPLPPQPAPRVGQ